MFRQINLAEFFWRALRAGLNSVQVYDLVTNIHAPALISQAQVMQQRFELLWLLQL
jgi:hypothetical protein